jgi:hypothetical protein
MVANARELRLIYGGHTKTDRLDAIKLARLARAGTKTQRNPNVFLAFVAAWRLCAKSAFLIWRQDVRAA